MSNVQTSVVMDSKLKFKDLIKIAQNELKDLTTLPNPDFRLEQAEFRDTENEWEIVVSFLIDNSNQSLNAINLPEFNNQRVYKRLKINAQREVKGFYIFEN